MRTLLNIIGTLLTLAMILVIVMALTGNLPGIGANTGHAPVNGLAVAAAYVNQPPASLPEINASTIGTAGAQALPGSEVLDTIGSADIAHKIGAK